MRKIIFSLILIGLMLITMTACNNKDNTSWYSIADNRVKVALNANYTTGYEWLYSIKDESIVSYNTSSYDVDSHEEGMVGVGGVYTAYFDCLKDGETTITFSYKRNWEDSSSQQKILLIRINNGSITLQELFE